jgi:hypothetical protein
MEILFLSPTPNWIIPERQLKLNTDEAFYTDARAWDSLTFPLMGNFRVRII